MSAYRCNGKRALPTTGLLVVAQFLLCLINSFATVQSLPTGAQAEQYPSQFGKFPAFFIENHGQAAKEVKYYFKGNDTIYFTNDGVVFQKIVKSQESGVGSQESKFMRQEAFLKTHDSLAYKLEFIGAKPTPPQARNELKGKVNYFIGNNPSKWHTEIPTYQEIVYPAPYEGIDILYKGVPGGMKYEFIVHPGANPDDIRLAYTGIEGLSIDDSGNLIIHTALGDVKDSKPYCYQEIDGKQVEVKGNFVIRNAAGWHGQTDTSVILSGAKNPVCLSVLNVGKTTAPQSPPSQGGDKGEVALATHNSQLATQFVYGFEVASYNKNHPLIIDPGLKYSTFLGGSGNEGGRGIAVDGSRNAYVAGQTISTDFPTTIGAFDTSFNGGGVDAFVTKVDSTGSSLLYSTFLGGSSFDEGVDIAVDRSGNAYVTGASDSNDFPTTVGAFDTGFNGVRDAFVTKLDAAGSSLLYSTFLGGINSDAGTGIAVDNSRNTYITGGTTSLDFPTTPGAFDTSFNSIRDAFVTKLDSTGSSLLYSTFLGGSGDDEGFNIAVDGSRNAYVSGQTLSIDFPTTIGVFDASFNGVVDAFVTKVDSTGSSLLYSTFLGGSGDDAGIGIAVDGSGNAYVTGRTGSTNFPTTPGVFDASFNGVVDAFVTKLDSTGSSLLYSTFLGGSIFDVGLSIALDSSRNAYVSGVTNSTDFPTTPEAFDMSFNGTFDAFMTRLDFAGSNLLNSTFLGGIGDDVGWSITVDSPRNAYMTGRSYSPNFPTTPGVFDTSLDGVNDAFVAKLSNIVCQCPADSPLGCVSGRVANRAGEPLAGKTVIFRGRVVPGGPRIRMNTRTNDDGCYQFNLSEGTGIVKVRRCIGGGSKSVSVPVGGKVNDVNFVCR